MFDQTRVASGLAILKAGIIRPGGAASGRWPVWLMYAFAVAVTAATMIIRLGLEEAIGPRLLLIIFIIPILLSAYAGGLGPGLVSTLMSAVSTSYFIIPPSYAFSFAKRADVVQWLILIVNGIFISGLCEALHRSRQRAERSRLLQAVTLASVGDGVITTDIRGNITFINPEAERLTGWHQPEATGQPLSAVFRIIHGETRQPAEDQMEKVLLSGEGASLGDDHVLLNRDGGELALEASAAAIKHADGALDGVVLVFHDHSEKKRAIREIERLASFPQLNPFPVLEVDAAGAITFYNQGAVKALEKLGPEFSLPDFLPADLEEIQAAARQTGEKLFQREIKIKDAVFSEAISFASPFNVLRFYIIDITERHQAEEALRESEEHYRSLFDNMLNGYAFCRMIYEQEKPVDFVYLEVNRAFEALTGLKDVVGKKVTEVIPGIRESSPELMEIYGRVATTCIPERFEVYVEALDMWFSVSVYCPGEGSFVVVFDVIDERKRAEEALRESEAKFRGLFESMTEGVALHELIYNDRGEAVDYRILSVNPAFTKHTGLQANQIEGQAASAGYGTGTAPFLDIFVPVAQTGQPQSFETFFPPLNRHFQVSATSPKPGHFVTVFEDITTRKQMEENLKRSEARLRRAEALGHLGHWSLDLRHIPVRLSGSEEMFRIYGVTPAKEDLTYQDLLQLVHPEDRESADQIMEKILREGQADFGYRLLRPDGELRYVNGMGELVRDETGAELAVFGTILDTSELRQQERELEERNAELERFTYTISHDLKSPLVTIKTFLEYLEQDMVQADGERVEKDMFYLRTAAEKMGNLLDELLEMSRIGRIVNPPVEATFREVVDEALNAVAGSIAARGVKVQVRETDCRLYGDRPRLVEVWQNLVENAVKFMGDQPSPRIEVGVEQGQKDAVFWVCDNGLGIDSRYQKKVFGLFEKLDPKTEGTGIGLALIKRIVEHYRGSIWLESKGLGQGTCFKFTLPAAVKN